MTRTQIADAKPIDLIRLRNAIPDRIFELPLLRTFGKALFLLAVLAAAVAVGTKLDSILLRLLIGVVMGPFLFALASTGHESGHCTASRNRFLNDLTGLLTMSIIGMPARGWKLKHDLHHKYGGVQGIDTDTDPGLENYLKLRWFPRTGIRLFNRHEFLFWWAAPFSLWFTTWKWALIDLKSRRERRRAHVPWLIADFTVALAFFAGLAVFVAAFGWLDLILLVAVPFFVSGYFSAIAFVPNHRGMPPLTAYQARRPARFAHLNSRTVTYPRFVPGNYFMNHVPWQTEHHIFPTVPGFRLKHLSPFLHAYAKEEGLPLAKENVFKVMPHMFRRKYLWGHTDGRLYTYRQAEDIRRARLESGRPFLKGRKATAYDNVEELIRRGASAMSELETTTAS